MELTLKPSYKQHLAYECLLKDNKVKYLLFGGGGNGGKSWSGCEWIIQNCLRYTDTRWIIARRELTKLKRTTLRTFFKVCRYHGLIPEVHYKYSAFTNTIYFLETRSEIFLIELIKKPSDPLFEDLGSLELTGGFVDEAGQIDFMAFDVLKSRIGRQNNDKHGIPPKLLLSCNPTKNWLYHTFYKPSKEGTLDPEYKFIQSLIGDNPYREKEAISQLESISNKATRQRLLLGSWEYDDDESRLFEYEDIIDIFTNKAEVSEEKYLSVDVARFGKDKTVIIYWKGLCAKKIYKFKNVPTAETVKKLEFLCEKLQIKRSHVIVDEDGLGAGVVDHFKGCKGFINNSKPIQPKMAKKDETKRVNYANLKSQCYFELARLITSGEIGIEDIDLETKEMLIQELECVREKDADKDGRIAVEGKDKVKEVLGRSPDIADALMMRCYFELVKKPVLKPFFVG